MKLKYITTYEKSHESGSEKHYLYQGKDKNNKLISIGYIKHYDKYKKLIKKVYFNLDTEEGQKITYLIDGTKFLSRSKGKQN
ncbi:hypothetical protein ACW95P_04090 [Candidatus Mycoplasma pogonae]